MGDKDKRFSTFIEHIFSEWVSKLQKVVEDAQIAGQVRDDLSANMLARHVVAAIEGGIMLARLEKDEKLFRDCLDSIKKLIGLKT